MNFIISLMKEYYIPNVHIYSPVELFKWDLKLFTMKEKEDN